VKPEFIVFVRGPEKTSWIWKNDRYEGHGLNMICSETKGIERWIQENDTSKDNRLRCHCTFIHLSVCVYNQLPRAKPYLIESLPVVELLRNIPPYFGTQRFVTMFTRSLPWSLS
jgi:hypothetical protein